MIAGDAARSGAGGPPPPNLLEKVIDALTDGVIVADAGGRVVLANPASHRLLGRDPTGVPAADWPSAFPWLLPDRVTACPPELMPLARAVGGETFGDLEVFVAGAAASEGVWLRVSGMPTRDGGGGIDGGVVVLRDVSAAKREIEQVELLSNVVEATADVVIVTDRLGRIEYVNPAFEAATGYGRGEVQGRNPSLLKSGVHSGEFYADLWRTLMEGGVFRGAFVNRKKSGELFVTEQTITPIRTSGGAIAHIVSVGKDVTQLRRAAERESALLLARSVQQRLFPAHPPRVPGLDIYGATFVADVTGGDYYDFVALPGERLGILVADVSGHGFDSALLMAETRAVLQATAQTTPEPCEILAVVNRVLHADTEAHHFATLLLVSLHLPSRSLEYASAGHPPGYLLGRGGGVKSELPATGLPLGLFPDSAYETRSVGHLEGGDTLVLLTDGVTECGPPEEDLFGADQALEVVRSSLGAGSPEIGERLYRAVRELERGGPQRDDITTVIVKCLSPT